MHHFCLWSENVSQMPTVSADYLMAVTKIQLLAEIAYGQLLCQLQRTVQQVI